MPKEFKKRGGRRSKKDAGDTAPAAPIEQVTVPQEDVFASNADFIKLDASDNEDPQPSSRHEAQNPHTTTNEQSNTRPDYVSGPTAAQVEIDLNAPFGFVDPDVKAYFKSVDEKLVEFTELSQAAGRPNQQSEADPAAELEDRATFLHSALNEVRGQELKLATDGDTAIVLERLLHSMGDWARRVLMDSFSGCFRQLFEHRFGSHVCQTLVGLAAETIDRESKGIWPQQHLQQEEALQSGEQQGHLRTATVLIEGLVEELLPVIPQLLTSPFASPPLRILLLLLSPGRSVPTQSDDNSVHQSSSDASKIRSKKSLKFRERGGKMTNILQSEDQITLSSDPSTLSQRTIPPNLIRLRSVMLNYLTTHISGPEWRAMGVENAGSPVVQMLLEIESEDPAVALQRNSILDHLTSGLITEYLEHEADASSHEFVNHDYLPSLLRDTTGSHLLQTILLTCPAHIFTIIWKTYFVGKVGKLAGHPIGNYVISSGVSRLMPESESGGNASLESLIAELEVVGVSHLIKSARTSVLKALVNRASQLGTAAAGTTASTSSGIQPKVMACVCKAFELETFPEKKLLVPCALTMNVYKTYQTAINPEPETDAPTQEQPSAQEEDKKQHGWKPRQPKRERAPLEPTMQGSLLLQSLFHLDPPAVETAINSLLAQPVQDLITMAHSAIGSRVLDEFLVSPHVASKWKRKFLLALDGKWLELVDDMFGSRVGDTIWDKAADGFMKVS